MKVVTAAQIRAADQFTIENEPISSIDLMERAAQNFTQDLIDTCPDLTKGFTIFCGIGNNGGDGLVIYRILKSYGFHVNCYVLNFSEKRSPDFLTNYRRLYELEYPVKEISEWVNEEIHPYTTIVDAVLGVGTDRPASGIIAAYIDYVNTLKDKHVVSVDVPTGMYSDRPNEEQDAIINSDITITFELPKLGFFLSPNENYIKQIEICPIGLHADFINSLDTPYHLITDEQITDLHTPTLNGAHKGSMGHLGIIAGKRGMMGAACLSAKAAMRSGVGKCTVFVPKIGRDVLQVSCPEVLVNDDYGNDCLQHCPDELTFFNALAVGPGLGTSQATHEAIRQLLDRELPTLVLDADALNIIAEEKWLNRLPKGSVLTPHPGEFKRLFGSYPDRLTAIQLQQKHAKENELIIVLKGHHTSVALPNGKVYLNTTGNHGLATAGTGDVLTGIIAGLMAQGYTPLKAALIGVHLHGQCADKALKSRSTQSIIASDIIEQIGLIQ